MMQAGTITQPHDSLYSKMQLTRSMATTKRCLQFMLWDCLGHNADTWNVDGRIIALFMEETSKLILRDLDQANNNSNRMDEYYPFNKAGELCFLLSITHLQ